MNIIRIMINTINTIIDIISIFVNINIPNLSTTINITAIYFLVPIFYYAIHHFHP